jgi:predicted nucleic acid-binding protein
LEAARIMRSFARNKGTRDLVAPDFLIGAHAVRQADGLITCDTGFYRQYFEGLTIITPAVGQ